MGIMENKMEIAIWENQMEKNKENEMETSANRKGSRRAVPHLRTTQ